MIPLLVRVICNDVPVVQSIIPPARDSYMQDNSACRKEALVKRSNFDERTPNERFDENIDLKATFDNPEQKEIEFLAQKLADEALGSPQLQRNIKKLANLNGTLHNPSEGMKGLSVNRVKSAESKVSKRKLLKGIGKRKKDKHKYGLRQREDYPRSRKRNHIKVSNEKILLFGILKCEDILLSKS